MTTLVKSYIDYSDVENPDWFKEVCENLYKIKRLEWELTNSWAGWLWRKKEYKNTIKELRTKNREILRSVYPKKEYILHFDIWITKGKKHLAMLHVFYI